VLASNNHKLCTARHALRRRHSHMTWGSRSSLKVCASLHERAKHHGTACHIRTSCTQNARCKAHHDMTQRPPCPGSLCRGRELTSDALLRPQQHKIDSRHANVELYSEAAIGGPPHSHNRPWVVATAYHCILHSSPHATSARQRNERFACTRNTKTTVLLHMLSGERSEEHVVRVNVKRGPGGRVPESHGWLPTTCTGPAVSWQPKGYNFSKQ
jgi:hypothetical protein